MGEDKAIEILQNCIADYVIGEYCEKCEDKPVCADKNEDCYFQQAIDTILDLYKHKKGRVEELKKELLEEKEKNKKVITYIKEKQKIQYKYALSQIECDKILELLEEE